ncbi:MAG: hypothetical protein KIT08_01330 [Anaerolineales bacterium]|nr:MAG: hypothetical protein KIT08_01330 [Anaerolineales bacterium]
MPANKVAAIIANHNLSERANALSRAFSVIDGIDVIVVDNGSRGFPPVNTTVKLRKNVRLTHAYLAGLAYADGLAAVSGEKYYAYWFLTTSLQFKLMAGVQGMVEKLSGDCVYVSPRYEGATRWPHTALAKAGVTRHLGGAGMYLAEWFDANSRFDPRLTYNWGTDYDTSLKAIAQGKHGLVADDVVMEVSENHGYKAGVHGMSVDEYHREARAEMDAVLSEKWPREWPLLREATSYDAVLALRN